MESCASAAMQSRTLSARLASEKRWKHTSQTATHSMAHAAGVAGFSSSGLITSRKAAS